MVFSVQSVSQISGVSVRTLHHYDAIGLLCPNRDEATGYRQYSPADLSRLQRILLYREVGFSLQDIRSLLQREQCPLQALEAHRQLLMDRIHRLQDMVTLVDHTILSTQGGVPMNPEAQFQPFTRQEVQTHQAAYEQEVADRYDSQLVQESQRRTQRYDDAAWARIQTQQHQLEQQLARYLEAGLPAESPCVQQVVEAYQAWIDQHFYPCSNDIFAGLGQLYAADDRFRAHYEAQAAGLADYLSSAIAIYCQR